MPGVKLHDVKIPASNFDGTIGLQDLFTMSGVSAEHIMITGGARHGDYHKSEMANTPKSHHNKANGFDFRGGANAPENEKLIKWLTESDDGKKWVEEWKVELITGDKYNDGHFHIGFRPGSTSKSPRVQKIYTENQQKWVETYGKDGLADFSKIDWDNPKGPISSEYVNPNYFNGGGGSIKSKTEYKGDNSKVYTGERFKETATKANWKDATDSMKAETFKRYADFEEEMRDAETDEQKKAIKESYSDVISLGKESYVDYLSDKQTKLKEENKEKYDLGKLDKNFEDIAQLKKERDALTAGVDDDAIGEIDKAISSLQKDNSSVIMKADFLKKRDRLDELKVIAKEGNLTASQKLELDGLKHQLPDVEQRKVLYGDLAKEVGLGTDETKMTNFLESIGKKGIHPYLLATSQNEFSDAYQKEYKEKWLASNDGSGGDNLEHEGNAMRRFWENTTQFLTTNTSDNPDAELGGFEKFMSKILPEAKSDEYMARREKGLEDLRDGSVSIDRFMFEEGFLEEYMTTEEEWKSKFNEDLAKDITGDIDYTTFLNGDDFASAEVIDEEGAGTDGSSDEEGAPKKGSATKNTDAEKFERGPGFQFDDTKGTLFEQAGGVDSLMGMVQLGAGLAESGEVKIPDEERINDMTQNHIQSVLRLTKIGMPLVEQAKMRESMDEAFNTAKRAIMDASGGNRAQALSAVTNLGAARQNTALSIEVEKSKSRAAALSDYGELMKYVNNFEAVEGRTKSAREFEIEKANKEAGGKLVGSGIDGILQAVNNNKLYGKGSAYDMTQQYVKWDLQGGVDAETDYQTGLKEVQKGLENTAGLVSDKVEAEQLNGSTVLLSQGFAGKAQEALNGINGIAQRETLARQEILMKQEAQRKEDEKLSNMQNDPMINENNFK